VAVAILSPHLDDAVLSAWAALRGDGDALVVNVFDGVPPAGTLSRWDRVTRAADSSDRMRERLAEDRAALGVARARAASLGLLENEYRDGAGPDAARLATGLAEAVAGRPEVWAPAAIGGHPDHVAVRDWALGLAGRGGARVHLYADLPYAARHGWPDWVTGGEQPRYYSHDDWWERHLPAGVRLAPEAHRLPEAEVELKLRALDAYRTQVYALDAGPIRMLRHPEVIGYEVSWAVEP
jgi:LmbE family N-acetylglucosaminyl deacetylase